MTIGQELKHHRHRQNISQVKLCKATGISQAHLSQLETGKKNITVNMLEKLCAELGLQVVLVKTRRTGGGYQWA